MSKKYFLGYFNKVSKILNHYDNKDFLRTVSIIKKIKKNKKKIIAKKKILLFYLNFECLNF